MTVGLDRLKPALSRLNSAISAPIVETTNWRTRDVFWLAAGLLMGTWVVVGLIDSPVLVLRAESLSVLVAATLAAVFLLSRRGVLLPSAKPLEPEAAAALARAKRGVGPLLALVLATGLALQLVSGTELPQRIVRPQLLVLSFFWTVLVFRSSSSLTRAEAICLCAALTVILLSVRTVDVLSLFLAYVVLAAVLHRLVFRRFDRLRMWTVRLMAGVLIAAGVYMVAFGLMGEVISAPLAIALAVFVGLDQRRDLRRHPRPECPFWRRPLFLGFASFLAWIVFLGWSGWIDHEVGAAGLGVTQWGRGGEPYPSTRGNPQQVAEQYEPLFVFAKREHWLPSDPAHYLRSARVLVDGTSLPGSDFPEGGTNTPCVDSGRLLNPKRRCVVTINCPDPDDDCAKDPVGSQPVVFARVVESPLEAEGFDRSSAKDPLRKLTRLIQYWAFYRYDDWRRWQFDGWHQWHEGDWEWVAVGLSKSGPIFAAYSAHCGGNWRTWKNLAALDGKRDAHGTLRPLSDHKPGRHVLAFVGQGTHATYPDARERAPNWATCSKVVPALADVLTWGPAHSINVREVMPVDGNLDERTQGPRVVLATEQEPKFMQLPVYWGPANHMRTIWHGGACPPQHPKEHCDRVAETPSLKPEWRYPIRTIFCNRWWHPRQCPRRTGGIPPRVSPAPP